MWNVSFDKFTSFHWKTPDFFTILKLVQFVWSLYIFISVFAKCNFYRPDFGIAEPFWRRAYRTPCMIFEYIKLNPRNWDWTGLFICYVNLIFYHVQMRWVVNYLKDHELEIINSPFTDNLNEMSRLPMFQWNKHFHLHKLLKMRSFFTKFFCWNDSEIKYIFTKYSYPVSHSSECMM